jgi:uncharacterized lipoprotein NlpE involved in copper resistance
MSKSLLLMASVLCTLLLLGCNKSDTTINRDGSASTNKAAPAASAAPAATASSAAKIGVAECDAYITAYEACVNDKVPAASRAQFNASLAQVRKSWHDLAANPQTRASLAQACKTAHEQAKQSMKAYGCTF